ncbi:MAG: patatin-like protein [Geobacteraceae bacterium]|nr:patatin-like protein [Geobacteraceae bacterium]
MEDSPVKTREVRLGLVMYGGVSLAIYINGVAQEFFRAVKGRGVYRLVKALTDSDIVVDIVSGTSAGGVNGILLGYALCNDLDFSASAALWRNDGSILKLLRDPGKGAERAVSVLDSEGYYQERLESAFSGMPPYVPEEFDDDSRFNEFDLFVTGSDVDGAVSTVYDDAGHSIDVKDHRSVFLLKHRTGRKEPFNTALGDDGGTSGKEVIFQALAKLARITSCFPAAFAPVQVALDDGMKTADALLQQWGRLGRGACFLDGGVLDNKPFSYAIEQIFRRMADREVDRKLFYVEPDPERFRRMNHPSEPNALQAVLAALIGIPGYESISEDLKLIARRNSKLAQYKRFSSCLQERAAERSSPAVMEILKKVRCGETNRIWDLPELLDESVRSLYRHSRLISISERVVLGVLRVDGKDPVMEPDARKSAARLYKAFDEWNGSGAETLLHFDVDIRLRRLYHLIYYIYDLGLAFSGANPSQYRCLWRALNRQVKLLEIIKSAMEELVDKAPITWQGKDPGKIWSLVQAAMQHLMSAGEDSPALLPAAYVPPCDAETVETVLNQEALSTLNGLLKQRINEITGLIRDNRLECGCPANFISLLENTDTCERSMLELFRSGLGQNDEKVLAAYDNFILIDAYLFPIEYFADLHEKDIIKTIRISPLDANKGFSNRPAGEKVAGDAFYHFGGFFKKSWRANDILWGRLDGMSQLLETLLDPARMRESLRDPEMRRRLRDRMVDSLDPVALFPCSGEKTWEDLRVWFGKLFSTDDRNWQKALEEPEFGQMVRLVIEAAQLEALHDDLPCVIKDAVSEQTEWNSYRVSKQKKAGQDDLPAYDADRAGFVVPASGDLDPLFLVVAADQLAESAVKRLTNEDGNKAARPSLTGIGRFFNEKYHVGSEEVLRDMPSLVLMEILAKALLDMRNCIMDVFGVHAARIKRSPIFMIMNGMLLCFYGLIQFMRRTPGWQKTIFIGAAILSLFLILIGVAWWEEIIMQNRDSLSTLWLAIFILVPVALLSMEGILLISGCARSGKRGNKRDSPDNPNR